MATILVAHGAWSAGWAWKKMHPLMHARGHRLVTPTYTGLGERAHLAHRGIDLDAHIEDLLAVMLYEDLRDVVLVGHSYGGMVATGVAERAAERVAQRVYLDAFVPQDGEALLDLVPPETRAAMRAAADAQGEGWRIPPNPIPDDTSEADRAWILPRRVMQPRATFEQRLRVHGAAEHLPRSYIYCTRAAPGDVFRPFAERAREAPGWRLFELDASHSPNVTAPEALADLLTRIAAG
ncbi:MAG: alpha/beta hydrolase [Burkholderiales bacterium]|nr:alpha/beta hydrolase [Burkholderiales bacterium]